MPSLSKGFEIEKFPLTLKLKAGIFKFLRFSERFRKLSFHDGLVWTVGITAEIRVDGAFSLDLPIIEN